MVRSTNLENRRPSSPPQRNSQPRSRSPKPSAQREAQPAVAPAPAVMRGAEGDQVFRSEPVGKRFPPLRAQIRGCILWRVLAHSRVSLYRIHTPTATEAKSAPAAKHKIIRFARIKVTSNGPSLFVNPIT